MYLGQMVDFLTLVVQTVRISRLDSSAAYTGQDERQHVFAGSHLPEMF